MKRALTAFLVVAAMVSWAVAYVLHQPVAAGLAAGFTIAAAGSVLIATLSNLAAAPTPALSPNAGSVPALHADEPRTSSVPTSSRESEKRASPVAQPEAVSTKTVIADLEEPESAQAAEEATHEAELPHPSEPVSARVAQADLPAAVAELANLDAETLVRRLMDAAAPQGRPVAAHVWLLDHASGTFRRVVAEGTLAPSDEPIDMDDDILGRATRQDAPILQKLRRLVSPSEQTTIWRYAFSITHEDIPGVAAVDLASDAEPSRQELERVTSSVRTQLVGALALHMANCRTASARVLIDVSRELSKRLDPESVVREVLTHAMALADAATGSVMLLEEDASRLRIVASEGLPDEVTATTLGLGEGIAGWVAASGQPLLVEDIPGRTTRGQRHGVRSAMSVPLADDDGLLGVLNVGSRNYPACFTQRHLEELGLLGRQGAVAYRNALAMTTTNELFFDSLKALALAIETKDPYATGATERVMEYAAAIGRAMRLATNEQRGLEIAAMLHDIGMTSLVDGVRACARPLTTVEQGLLKMHPVVAADILKRAPALRTVAPIVYHHHEHYDGSGYASGLAGEDIPLGARILAVVDAYVAMTSDRPYRRALSRAQASAELAEKAGTQFDPEIVEAFLRLLDSETDRVQNRP